MGKSWMYKLFARTIHLGHNMGVFLYDDLLSIMSIHYQTVHILQIRDAGTFVDVRAIGTYCREDDKTYSQLLDSGK